MRETTHIGNTCGSASITGTYIIVEVVITFVPNTTRIIGSSNQWRNKIGSGMSGPTTSIEFMRPSLLRVYDLSISISATNQPKITTNFIAF